MNFISSGVYVVYCSLFFFIGVCLKGDVIQIALSAFVVVAGGVSFFIPVSPFSRRVLILYQQHDVRCENKYFYHSLIILLCFFVYIYSLYSIPIFSP